MISKRIFSGNRDWIGRLEQAFNGVKPRTAQSRETGDGNAELLVVGWPDAEAAAVYTMCHANLPSFQINERSVIAKSRELLNGARNDPSGKLNPIWLGSIISSEVGGASVVTPPELQEAVSGAREAPSPADEEEDLDTPLGGELPPEPDYTQPPPEAKREADRTDAVYHTRLPGQPDPWTGGGFQPIPVPPPTPILPSGDILVSMRVDKESWRLIRLLAVAWEIEPNEAIERLLDERLSHYRNPTNLAWLTGASDN